MTQSPQHTADKEKQANQLWQVYHSCTHDYFWARYEALLASQPKVATFEVSPPDPKPAQSKSIDKPAPVNLQIPPTNEPRLGVFKPQKWTYINRGLTLMAIPVSVLLCIYYVFFSGLEQVDTQESWLAIIFTLIFGIITPLALVAQPAYIFSVAKSGVYIQKAFASLGEDYFAWANIADMQLEEIMPQTENDQIKHMLTIVPKKGATQSFIYHLSDNDHRDFVRVVKRHVRYFKCTSSKYYPV